MLFMIVPWKKLSMILASLSLILITAFVPTAQGDAAENYPISQPQPKAVILYESRTRFGESFPLVSALEEYLGHFNVQAEELERSKWTSGGLKGFDYIFYIGDYKANLPSSMLSEMSKARKLFWFEQNIQQYANYKKWVGFQSPGQQSDFVSLHYRGEDLPIDPAAEFNVAYPANAENLVTADNLHHAVPFVWKMDNVVYVSRLDFQMPLNLILGGILEDTLSENLVESRQVLLRIEDVLPLTPSAALAKLINTLATARVPFALTVTPVVNIEGKTVTLADYPQLVQVLKTVESNGGCLILKGYEATNDNELEYWNTAGDKPLAEDKETLALSKIRQGIELLAGLDLYPLAFEVPGSAMSSRGYKALAQYFTTLSGQVQLSDTSSSVSVDVPFTYRSKRAGMLVYPNNLGYYDPKLLDPSGTILEQARQLSVVSDCTAGLFFHSYLPPEKLLPIIKGLSQLKYRFVDLRTTSYRVTTPHVSITSENGYRRIKSDIPAISIDQPLSGLRLSVRNWFYVLASLLLIILSLFLLILSRIRRSKSNLYEKRRS